MWLKTTRWLLWAGIVLLLGDWITKLGSGQPYERQKAAKVLGEMGPSAAPAVRALVAALADEDRELRRHCAFALARIGPAAAGAAEVLVAAAPSLVADPDAGAVVEYAFTGDDSDHGIEAEFPGDVFLDFWAYAGILVPFGPRAVPALIEGLRHEHPGVRLSAAAALARLGPGAKEAIPALIEALQDPVLRKKMRDQYPDEALRHPGLRQTVRERYPDLALPDDPRLLEHSFRQMAVALGQMGPDTKDAAPVILGAFADRCESTRSMRMSILSGIGPITGRRGWRGR